MSKGVYYLIVGVKRVRPLLRRRLSTLRPPGDAERLRNPCRLKSFLLFLLLSIALNSKFAWKL